MPVHIIQEITIELYPRRASVFEVLELLPVFDAYRHLISIGGRSQCENYRGASNLCGCKTASEAVPNGDSQMHPFTLVTALMNYTQHDVLHASESCLLRSLPIKPVIVLASHFHFRDRPAFVAAIAQAARGCRGTAHADNVH